MSRIVFVSKILFCAIVAASCQQFHSNALHGSDLLSNSDAANSHAGANSPQSSPTPTLTPVSHARRESGPPSLTNSQLTFGMEYEVKQKSPVPGEIWKKIIDGETNDATKQQVLAQNDPDIWVDSSKIDLNKDSEADYVIVAKRGNWLGANITTFWVFLNDGGPYRQVLRTSALQIDFLNKRKNGFRVITAAALTSKRFFETRYVYEGQDYEIQASKSGNIR